MPSWPDSMESMLRSLACHCHLPNALWLYVQTTESTWRCCRNDPGAGSHEIQSSYGVLSMVANVKAALPLQPSLGRADSWRIPRTIWGYSKPYDSIATP